MSSSVNVINLADSYYLCMKYNYFYNVSFICKNKKSCKYKKTKFCKNLSTNCALHIKFYVFYII